MNDHKYTIIEEKNVIDDHLLDIIGVEFKFDHQKGLAEWLKNSADAYIRVGVPDKNQFVFLRFIDSEKGNAVIECIDFIGMSVDDIVNAFKRWGDPEAAKRGLKKKTYGGHGNGGKFYMRQMFRESCFITYREGKLNVFGFSQNRKYGFAKESGKQYRDVQISPDNALEYANIKQLPIPEKILSNIKAGKTGFTVVRGIAPFNMVNKIQVARIVEKLRNHPQARKIIDRMNVGVVHNGKVLGQITPNELKPMKGFEAPFVFSIPKTLTYIEQGEKHTIDMVNDTYKLGELILKTSEEALERNGVYGELNRIDILGEEIGTLAYYPIYELGNMYNQSVFVYGECICPILEDPKEDIIKNDRSRLAEHPRTHALIQWISERVNEVAEKILAKEKEEQKQMVKELSRAYNQFLNSWSAKFLNKIRSELLVGPGEGAGIGFGTGGSSGGFGDSEGRKGGRDGSGKGEKEGGGNTPKKKPRNPRVLLSGMDSDPLNQEGGTLILDPRQGVIYQRLQDVQEGIYWINTASPLAKSVLERFGERSQQWRSYLFQRYVDIFIKEELRNLFKKNTEYFNPDVIDSEIFGRFMLKIHDAAANDLEAFLLEERYELEEKNGQ